MVAFGLCLAGLVLAEGRDLVGDATGSDIVQRRMLESPSSYCVPGQSCWPSNADWQSLAESLSQGPSALTALAEESYDVCYEQYTNAIGLMQEGHGACMQDNHCKFEACAGDGLVNLPAYSVAAATVADVQAALAFASTHDLSVSVKTSGHSYAGSSAMKGSLLIWMAEFEKFGTIATHTDSCGTATEQVLKVGGGQVWGEAYPVVGDAGRDIVGGGGLTVAAAGGWLMGGGLSALSRTFGYGIDNVVAFEVVAADGVLRTADACSEPDLFWALRGGGGGAFGVVTAAYHRTHASSAVAALSMSIDITGANWESRAPVVEKWLDFWVETSPTIGREWSGGYWTLSSIVVLYFRGTASEAEATFVGALREWRARLTAEQQQYVTISLTEFDSYWASRTAGCRDSSSVACRTFGAETDATGQAGVNIHSRMIPAAWVTQNNGAEAKATLKWMMYNGWSTFNYFLGGAVTDVAADETAVHPSVRDSIWNMEVFDPRLIERLRDDLPDSGVCYNHAAKDEPDWDAQAWGANLPRLLQVKAAYDPANRLNCFHCVGYQSLGGDDLTPATCEGMYNCATGPGDEPAPQPPGTQPLPPASPQPPSLPVGAATYFYSSADCTGTPTVLAIGHGGCVGDEWGYFYTISCAAGASNLSWFSNADCSGDADGTLGSNEEDGTYGGWLLGKADGSSGPIRPSDCWTWATSATDATPASSQAFTCWPSLLPEPDRSLRCFQKEPSNKGATVKANDDGTFKGLCCAGPEDRAGCGGGECIGQYHRGATRDLLFSTVPDPDPDPDYDYYACA